MSRNPYEAPLTNDMGALDPGPRETKALRRIHPLQAGKVLGVMYLIGGLIAVPILLAVSLAEGETSGLVAAVLIPLFYGVIGFLGGALAALLYNGVASLTGGLRFDWE